MCSYRVKNTIIMDIIINEVNDLKKEGVFKIIATVRVSGVLIKR